MFDVSDRPTDNDRSSIDSNRQAVPTITAVDLISRTVISDNNIVIPGKARNRVRTQQTINLIVRCRPKQ